MENKNVILALKNRIQKLSASPVMNKKLINKCIRRLRALQREEPST